MKIHKVEETLAKAIRDVTLELSAMEPGQVNQYNESRESLTEELAVMQQMAQLAADLSTCRSRAAIDRMSKMFHLEG